MNSLKRLQKINKILHVLSVIVFVCSIVTLCISCIATLCFAIWGNNPDVINFVASFGEGYDFNVVMCFCVCAIVDSAFYIALYYYIKRFYKQELDIGTPFDKKVVKQARLVGILHIVLPLASIIVSAIVVACFGTQSINYSNASAVVIGIVYLIVSCVLEYGTELPTKKKGIQE